MTNPPSMDLQFDRLEPREQSVQGTTCSACSQPIVSVYYEMAGSVICEKCYCGRSAEVSGTGAGRFARALMAGGGAAIGGSLLYYAVSALTGYEFGLIAIVVGIAVGKAVRWGSRDRGGWRYQTLAIALTYFAIASTYIPFIIKAASEQQAGPVAATPSAKATPAAASSTPAEASSAAKEPEAGITDLFVAIGLLALVTMAAPFLAGFENIIGILIILFGLFEAWKINRKVEVAFAGPFRLGASELPVVDPPTA